MKTVNIEFKKTRHWIIEISISEDFLPELQNIIKKWINNSAVVNFIESWTSNKIELLFMEEIEQEVIKIYGVYYTYQNVRDYLKSNINKFNSLQ